MRIERPQFLPNPYCGDNFPSEAKKIVNDFHIWFDKNVEPINKMLDEGVEVRCPSHDKQGVWYTNKNIYYANGQKALLINITPIKKESAEDILHDMATGNYPKCDSYECEAKMFEHFIKRAKAVLDRGRDE